MQCLVVPGHTTMSDMPENPMVDAKIMNLLQFCPKLYQQDYISPGAPAPN